MDQWYTLDSPPVIPFRALEDVATQMRRGGHHHLLDSDLALAMAWERFSHLFYQTDTPVFLPHNNTDQRIEMIEDVMFHADLTLGSILDKFNEEWDMIESEKKLGLLPTLNLLEEDKKQHVDNEEDIGERDVEKNNKEVEDELLTPRQLISFYDERKLNTQFIRAKMRLASLQLE